MMRLIFIIFVVSRTVTAKEYPACVTPTKESAKCIPIRSCKVIFEAILSKTVDVDFAKKSQCGYDKQPLVCCGSKADLTYVGNFHDLHTGRNESCVTPNEESAKCIPVRSCIPILKAIETGNPNFIEFAKKSQCGYDTEALVCCGKVGHLIPREQPPSNFGSIFPNSTICGLERQTDRVKGGEITELDEFPWMAALEYVTRSNGTSQGIKCGATIINQRYLLTAAHCIVTDDLLLSRAWLGEWRLSTDPDCQQIVAYSECADPVVKLKITIQIAHPNFNRVNGRHDIGLLGVEKDIQYTDFIRPICMPTENLPAPEIKSILTVAGWGITDDGKESDVKLKVGVPLLSNEACNAKLHVPLTPNQYCAGGEIGKDSCRGDSGGPLMRSYQSKISLQPQWYLEGVVSYGLGCGREGYPAIYTRVTKYISWIANTIAQKGS